MTVSDQKGCTNNIDVAIANGEELLIPTGISPNGDGINDTWEIPGSYQYDDIVVSIFNLQGQLFYYQNKNYIPWDGKYKGELVPVGDYYFVIESLSHKRKQTGTITVKYWEWKISRNVLCLNLNLSLSNCHVSENAQKKSLINHFVFFPNNLFFWSNRFFI